VKVVLIVQANRDSHPTLARAANTTTATSMQIRPAPDSQNLMGRCTFEDKSVDNTITLECKNEGKKLTLC
jgi:cell division inhibitor SulA